MAANDPRSLFQCGPTIAGGDAGGAGGTGGKHHPEAVPAGASRDSSRQAGDRIPGSANAASSLLFQEGPIPGLDPGACPKCGEWRKAGIPHECVNKPSCESHDHTWDGEAVAAFEDGLDSGGFAPGEEDGDV